MKAIKYPIGEVKVVCFRETSPVPVQCDSTHLAAKYWHNHVATAPAYTPDQEQIVVYMLDSKRKITGHQVISLGTLDSCLIHPRNVFRAAIVSNASAVIMVHNHPSGDPSPSKADINMSREINKAGTLLKIPLLDSIIMGDSIPSRPNGFFSLFENGYLL